jgi:hypothetical protein
MKKEIWNSASIKEGFLKFFKQHGYYPTATEVDTCEYLPAARTIERRFGGLVAFRKDLHIGSQTDFRFGEHSSKRALTINTRAHKVEKEVYEYLVKRFGTQFVHREYFFTDDKRTRADFFVFDTAKGFCVDVFFALSFRNVSGCLNSKLGKYQSEYMRHYPVIFLQMNAEIVQEKLDLLVQHKKRRVPNGQTLMSWGTFKRFCESRSPLHLSKA